MARIRYFVRPVKQRAWLPGQEPYVLGLNRHLRLHEEKLRLEKEAQERQQREERERPHRELRKKMRLVPASRHDESREPDTINP